MGRMQERIGFAWGLVAAFVVGGAVGSCTAQPPSPLVESAQPPASDRDCFPKGVLIKTENMGVVCIDARAIYWDGNP